jgi:hypothetical protein
MKKFNIKMFCADIEVICGDGVENIEYIKNIIIKGNNNCKLFKIGKERTNIFLSKEWFNEKIVSMEMKLWYIGNIYIYGNLKDFVKDIIVVLYDEFEGLFNDKVKIYLV